MPKLTRQDLCPIEVPFDFIDAGGVVYHPRYYILLERARYDYCKKKGLDLYAHFEKGFVFVVAELGGKYRKPLRVAEKYEVMSIVDQASSRSIKMRQYLIAEDRAEEALKLQDDERALEKCSHFAGHLHLVHVDMKAMKAHPIPPDFLTALE